MTIISKYVLREHVGPLTFALTALTSLMLLQFISRQFGELVGKGLPWSVIGEFFLLSIPFTVALTVPMSVLVAVLYAFSRLAGENEVTAMKASGVSPWRLVSPAVGGGLFCALVLLAFSDQVLPRANHRLKTLQDDISQTKPTFLLKEQVINSVVEGKYYLKAGKIDRASDKNLLREVVIYDLADPTRRRTIYADDGAVQLSTNGRDLVLDLYHGQMQELASDKPGQLNRLFFQHDLIRFKDVASGDFKQTEAGASSKSDREMSVCEMQRRLWQASGSYEAAQREYDAVRHPDTSATADSRAAASALGLAPVRVPEPRGIGWAYCRLVDLLHVKDVEAATLPPSGQVVRQAARQNVARRDTVRRDSVRRDTTRRVVPRTADRFVPARKVVTPAPAPGGIGQGPQSMRSPDDQVRRAQLAEAKLRLDIAQRARNRYEIEIHKKFSLSAACVIFVIIGAPIAVRFPRGGVGLVIGVSLLVFALYYVGLIGGESLANEGIIPPFWAMWGTNVILTIVGVVLFLRMGRDSTSNRGGDWSDKLDALLAKFGRGPQARLESLS
ncbi:MAG: YjgP/YjgQ family permease [Gemmatimonadaceae bacterium]|nr:YjgP/YjgQ family permease [Gemmatimonadaceae bacterium]